MGPKTVKNGGSVRTAARAGEDGDFAHNRVRQLRRETGLSTRRLAEELGVNYRTLGYLEREEVQPSLSLAWEIAGQTSPLIARHRRVIGVAGASEELGLWVGARKNPRRHPRGLLNALSELG